MSHQSGSAAFSSPFRKVKWRLTLSYFLVSIAAIFILVWWALVVTTLYLRDLYPTLTWMQLIEALILPALRVILPSILLLVVPAALVGAYFGFLNAGWLDQRLANMRQAVKAWRSGDFSVNVKDPVEDEVGSFGQELNVMAGELERLLQTREELSAVEERNQLARDLHDSVKQQITAAAFQVSAAKALLAQGRSDSALSALSEAENLVIQAHQELNTIILELRPVSLPGNLSTSLREYVQRWSRQSAIDVRMDIQEIPDLPVDLQAELIRFAQEALSNVARHSQASQVQVSLLSTKSDLQLSVEDNGQGFDPGGLAQPGFGLKTMRERISRCGGTFTIEPNQPTGTRVIAQVSVAK